jgi:hypothetical protein
MDVNSTRRSFLIGLGSMWAFPTLAKEAVLIVDDLSTPGTTSLGTPWMTFTDQVMGGRSVMNGGYAEISGRTAYAMVADVTTANNGGFAQMAAYLHEARKPVDLSAFTTLELDVLGNDEAYDIHLRTTACRRPWEYYTQRFIAPDTWTTVRLPLVDFKPKSLRRAFDSSSVLRLGIVAYGRDFHAELAVSRVAFTA